MAHWNKKTTYHSDEACDVGGLQNHYIEKHKEPFGLLLVMLEPLNLLKKT